MVFRLTTQSWEAERGLPATGAVTIMVMAVYRWRGWGSRKATPSGAWLRPWNVRRSLAVSRSEFGLLFLRVEHDAIRLLKAFVRARLVGLGLPLLRHQGNEGGLRSGLVLEALLPVGDLRLQAVFLPGEGFDLGLQLREFGGVRGGPGFRLVGLQPGVLETPQLHNEHARKQRAGGERPDQSNDQRRFDDGIHG